MRLSFNGLYIPIIRGGHVTQAGQSTHTLGSSDLFGARGHMTQEEPVTAPDGGRIANGLWEKKSILFHCNVHVKLKPLELTKRRAW